MVTDIRFAAQTKSFTNLLFEHITKENREVGVTLRKTKLMSDVGTLVIVSWLTRVGLDILTLQTNCIQATYLNFLQS